MTTEERLANIENALMRVATSQGNLAEGRLRVVGLVRESVQLHAGIYETLNTRILRLEAAVHEIDDKLNGLIGVMDGLIRDQDRGRDLI